MHTKNTTKEITSSKTRMNEQEQILNNLHRRIASITIEEYEKYLKDYNKTKISHRVLKY